MTRLIPLLLILLCCGCDKSSPDKVEILSKLKKHQFTEPHLGTVVQIIFYSSDDSKAAGIAEQCFARVEELNRILSDYDANSDVSELCSLPIGKPHKVCEELFHIISHANTISEKTKGAFDITIGKFSKQWRQRKNNIEQDPLDEQIPTSYRDLIIDHEKITITLKKPLMIDLGAIGKGFIADQLMVILKKASISRAAIIIGGETVLADPPPEKEGWHIGIEDTEQNIIGKVILSNTCVSTSGDSYQFFEEGGERQAHVIDPQTKQGKTNRLNVITIAPSAMIADAWATALRVLPMKNAIIIAENEPDVEALFIPHQMEFLSSKNFPPLNKLSKIQK